METYSIGELAKLTDVTVKTIRHYEKMKLLFPAYDPDNGYRRYGKEDVIRLEMILALKLLGFELSEIAKFLTHGFSIDSINLSNQKSALIKKITEMKKVISLIDLISDHKNIRNVDLVDIVNLIKELQMQERNIDWYLEQSEEDMRKLGTGYPANKKEEKELREIWDSLLSRAETLTTDFHQRRFEELAEEWLIVLYKCIGDNPVAINGLISSYSLMGEWPKDRQLFNPMLGEFIGPKLHEYHRTYIGKTK